MTCGNRNELSLTAVEQRRLVGTTTYAGYDGVGRLTALTHTDGAGALIASYNMGYDRAHRLVSGSHANRYGNQTQAYTYDAAGQLMSAVRTGHRRGHGVIQLRHQR